MSIKAGDPIPQSSAFVMGNKGPKRITTNELFNNKKVVVFALPGAYTPTCSAAHLPGFVVNAEAIKAKGVDSIICLSVNDPFVMSSWGEEQNAEEIIMLGDGNADLTRAIGMDIDASRGGMGIRSKRYAMIVDNGIVTYLAVDEPGKFEVSSADQILEALST